MHTAAQQVLSAFTRAWRMFQRRPGFFVIAVSSLAIALGLATTVIAQIDSLMHPWSPIRDVERVYGVSEYGFGKGNAQPAYNDVRDALQASGLFEAIAASSRGFYGAQIEIGPGLLNIAFRYVGRDYFEILGVRPRLGRLFTPGESFDDGVAIVGERFWRQYMGNATTLENAQFTYEGRTFRVVGVLGTEWENAAEYSGFGDTRAIWTPPRVELSRGGRYAADFVARLKPSVTEKNAQVVLRTIANRWRAQYGEGRPPFRVGMRSLKPDPLRLGEFQIALIGAAIFILVIASANVSALMLARSVANRRDQALRLALGARAANLFLDVTAEITIIAVAGAVLGVVIAFVAMGIMTALTPPEITWLGLARANWSPRVFTGLFAAMALSIAGATAVPAWYVTRIAPAEPLKDGSGTTSARAQSGYKLVVVGELALAMVLLLGASLISRTAHNVATFDFGYEARNVHRAGAGVVVVSKLSPPVPPESARVMGPRRTPEILAPELDAIVARLRALPSINGAAWFANDGAEHSIVVSQESVLLDSMLYNPMVLNVGPGFMATLGLRIVEGRDFSEGDRTVTGSVILDELSARRLFPQGHPIGKMVKLGDAKSAQPWVPIVGIARTAIHDLPEYPEMDVRPVVYVSRQKARGFFPEFVIRANRGVNDIAPLAARTIRDAMPPRTYVGAGKWLENYDALLAGRRFTAGLFATLSLASLILATAGLFGVLSYAINQRMREFALRVALGAQRKNILGLVAHDALVMVLGGTAIGAFVGMYAAFAVYYWLWGVYPVDVVSLVIAEAVLLGVTAAASAIPALRAVRANPADALRAI